MRSIPISREDQQRIEQFINVFRDSVWCGPAHAVLSDTEAYFAQRCPGQLFWVAPREMICGPPDADGNAPWHPIDSPIDDAMVEGFERHLQAPLPPLFKAYLTQKCLIGMDLYEGVLPSIDPRQPLEWLEWSVLRRRGRDLSEAPWLIPFSHGPAELGILCFDTRRPDGAGDYPVIMVRDLDDDGGSREDREGEIGRQVFDSFGAYLAFLQDWLVYKSSGSALMFLEWLRQHDKPEPPPYYYGS